MYGTPPSIHRARRRPSHALGRLLAVMVVVCAWVLAAPAMGAGAPGGLDASFTNPDVDSDVMSMAMQADGRVLIGGAFTAVGGQTRTRMARLNTDGTPDTTFPDLSIDASVVSVAVQPDGKVLIGGGFSAVGGQTRTRVARLNADGTLDTTFRDPSIPNGSVRSVALQPDGKVIIGGSFLAVDGQTRTRVARLNADGSLDATFQDPVVPGGGPGGGVYALALLPDGRIVLGGNFQSVGGQTRVRAARLNSDGSLDTTFGDPNVDSTVTTLALQADGKLVIGGDFTTVGSPSQTRPRVARLNADGSVDASFQDANVTGAGGFVRPVAVQADGKILIGGNFNSVGGQSRIKVARLNADGTLDPTFEDPDVGGGSSDYVLSLVMQPDGRLLVGGQFTTVRGLTWDRAARLFASAPQVAPGGVVATAGNGQATVSWERVVGEITSYVVTASPGGHTCIAVAPATSCTVTGLTDGTRYTCTVAAANDLGAGPASSPSNPVTPTSGAVSPVATTLRATVAVSRRSVVSGQVLRVRIGVANTGATTATSVRSCVRLPGNLVITRAAGASRSGQTVCFAVGDIATGASVARCVTVRAVSARRVVRRVTGAAYSASARPERVSAVPVVVRIRPAAARARVTG